MPVKDVTSTILDALGDEIRQLLDPTLDLEVSLSNSFDYFDVYHRKLSAVMHGRIVCRVDLYKGNMYVLLPHGEVENVWQLSVPIDDPNCFAKITESVLKICQQKLTN